MVSSFTLVWSSQFRVKNIEPSKFLIVFVYPRKILKTTIVETATECKN